jgi:hypothetical protein
LVSIERGQFLCGAGGCQLLVRFDDAPATGFAAAEPADGTSTAVFVRSSGQFLKSLRAAHRVLVEATFYQEDTQVVEFAPQGLERAATKEEGAYANASKIAAARHAALARCTPSPAYDACIPGGLCSGRCTESGFSRDGVRRAAFG